MKSIRIGAGIALVALTASCSSARLAANSAGTNISIGVIGSFTGAVAEPEIPKVLDAWAKDVDAHGGLHGHRVQLTFQDVGNTTGAGLAAAKNLIENDHAVAILDFDSSDATWASYVASNHVPAVAGFASIASLLTPDVFPVITSPIALAYGLVAEARTYGKTAGMAYAAETPEAGQIVQLAEVFGKSLGVKVGVAVSLSSSAPDYTAFCQQLKEAHVASYSLAFSAEPSRRITDECYSEGVRIPQLMIGPDVTPQWRTDPAYQGDLAIDGAAPFFDQSVPGVKAYRETLGRYAPGLIGSTQDSSVAGFAWAAAQMLAQAIQRTTGNVTPSAVQRSLSMTRAETLSGLIAPVSFSESAASSINCWFTWKLARDNFALAASGAKPTCAPRSALEPIEQSLIKSMGGT